MLWQTQQIEQQLPIVATFYNTTTKPTLYNDGRVDVMVWGLVVVCIHFFALVMLQLMFGGSVGHAQHGPTQKETVAPTLVNMVLVLCQLVVRLHSIAPCWIERCGR